MSHDPYHVLTTEEKQVLDPVVTQKERVKWDNILPLVPNMTKQQCINYVNSKRNPRKKRNIIEHVSGHLESTANLDIQKQILFPNSSSPVILAGQSLAQEEQVLPDSSEVKHSHISWSSVQSGNCTVQFYFEHMNIDTVVSRTDVIDNKNQRTVRNLLFMMQTDAFYEYHALNDSAKDPVVYAMFYFQRRYTREQIEAARRYSQLYCPNFHVFEKFGGVAAYSTVFNFQKSIEQVQIAQIALQIQRRIRSELFKVETEFQQAVDQILSEDLIICEAVIELLSTFKACEILKRRSDTHAQLFGLCPELQETVGLTYLLANQIGQNVGI